MLYPFFVLSKLLGMFPNKKLIDSELVYS